MGCFGCRKWKSGVRFEIDEMSGEIVIGDGNAYYVVYVIVGAWYCMVGRICIGGRNHRRGEFGFESRGRTWCYVAVGCLVMIEM